MALLDKIRRNSVALAELAGVTSLYGVKTGLNEAFVLDGATRERLIREDPRRAQHAKDEALRYFTTFVDSHPMPAPPRSITVVQSSVEALVAVQEEATESRRLIADWYHHSLRIQTIPNLLRDPFRLTSDQFVSAIGKACGKKRKALTAATIGHIRDGERGQSVSRGLFKRGPEPVGGAGRSPPAEAPEDRLIG